MIAFLLLLLPLAAHAQMRTGEDMARFAEVFGVEVGRAQYDYEAVLFASSAPGNVLHPGEQPEFSFQLQNNLDRPLKMRGQVDLTAWGTRAIRGDIWLPEVFKLTDLRSLPIEVDIEAGGFQNFSIQPWTPGRKGGYALVVDLGEHGRRLLTTYVRTFAPDTSRVQYPYLSMEALPAPVLARLGIKAIRKGVPYVPSDQDGYARFIGQLDAELKEYHAHRITVVLEVGAGTAPQPLGRPRPHLDDEGVMQGGKMDHVWLPEKDGDFGEFVFRLARDYGWPGGPVNGIMLWNEPWEGSSISGWQADMPRYRALYRRMGEAVVRARETAGVDVLVGGCDSSSNTWDKLFGDGSLELLPYLDFCSVHYQGLAAPALYPEWSERRAHKGRVLIWDTESWMANADDRFAAVVATKRAAGYDRALGIFSGYVSTASRHGQRQQVRLRGERGSEDVPAAPWAWPPAAAVGAAQHFIGERPFREILFKKGLPWIYVFDGRGGDQEDGTLVVVGDVNALFPGQDALFRTVRSLVESEEERELAELLVLGVAEEEERPLVLGALQAERPFEGAELSLAAQDGRFQLFDFYGNRVEVEKDRIEVPLKGRAYFLRGDGGSGSFAALVEAVREARIEGIEPVEVVALDMTEPIASKPTLRLRLTNVLNRPVEGKLRLRLGRLAVKASERVNLAAHESLELDVQVHAGTPSADNIYPLFLVFDAGRDGRSIHYEEMRVNLIHRRSIEVDGRLEDWQGALPQKLVAADATSPPLSQAAWQPAAVNFAPGQGGGLAVGYLAYDEENFYFAAKIADATPPAGTLRFASRDDDSFFYPPTSYEVDASSGKRIQHVWPQGVRRFSYRREPVLPSGDAPPFDNVQIAFNAIPLGEDGWLAHLPGRMPRFSWYRCTDYEYALNKVAPEYGGGTEVWRLQVPGMVRKHFYPRQDRHPLEGAVAGARLAIEQEGETRVVELALPWAEIPHVRHLLEQRKGVKFSFRVNYEGGGPPMELARQRSVSKRNSQAFHVDWQEHWANEVEFGWE